MGWPVLDRKMVGWLCWRGFYSGSGISGTVKITDPGVLGGGTQLGGAHALGPRIAFDARLYTQRVTLVA